MRPTATFAAVALGLIAAVGLVGALLWPDPAARRAVVVSAGVALVVQVLAFVIVRRMAASNVMAGWGVGMLLRLLTLAVYALVTARSHDTPLAPALISLVAFFFVTSLVEPVLLRT